MKTCVTESDWGKAAHCSKANLEARLVERKVCLILDASNEVKGWIPCPIQGRLPNAENQWARTFIYGGRWLHAETVQSVLPVILTLVMWWFDHCYIDWFGDSLISQLVKNPPGMQETWVQSLGWEDPLEKGKAIHSSILAWKIAWMSPRGHKESDRTEWLSLHFICWFRYSLSSGPG